MGCHFLLQWIFPTQESNPGLLHCWQILNWATREAFDNTSRDNFFIYLVLFTQYSQKHMVKVYINETFFLNRIFRLGIFVEDRIKKKNKCKRLIQNTLKKALQVPFLLLGDWSEAKSKYSLNELTVKRKHEIVVVYFFFAFIKLKSFWSTSLPSWVILNCQ